ncbi:MAG: hypothetical protein ACPG6L_11510 [Nereida ignava]
MIRFLTPTTAMLAIIAGLAFALWWSVTSHADTRAALKAATAYIQATEDVRNAQETVPNDPELIPGWLREFADGG